VLAEESYWLTYCSPTPADDVCQILAWYALDPTQQAAWANEVAVLQMEMVIAQEYAAMGYDACAVFGYSVMCSWGLAGGWNSMVDYAWISFISGYSGGF